MSVNPSPAIDPVRARAIEEKRIRGENLDPAHTLGCTVLPTREHLLDVLPKGGIAAELGVAYGDFSEQILARMQPRELYLLDLWEGERYAPGYDAVTTKLAEPLARGQVIIKRGYSTKMLETFEDGFFDFIYIDTTHAYDLTLQELRLSSRKIKPNGLIAGHDFSAGNIVTPVIYGVIQACNRFCRENHWKYRYLTLESTSYFSFCLEKMA